MIRPYRPSDLSRLREICVLTGAAGGDATGRWSTDDLLPDLFLEPYTTFAPGWAWVLELDGVIQGYLVAVSDTAAFVAWWRDTWTPWFAVRYPRPGEPYSEEEELVLRGYRPEVMLVDEHEGYPAHLHIDLLPPAQGRGWGAKLIDRLRSELADVGVPGVHVTLDPENTAARGFYERLGFRALPSSSPAEPVLGIATSRAR
ncbi:MAG: GNAT family N-acetyltransferase [Microbacteriaceae bacterium]|nr:GNAT family N-acetyltransferase [Microbacteriaceae bacterium]